MQDSKYWLNFIIPEDSEVWKNNSSEDQVVKLSIKKPGAWHVFIAGFKKVFIFRTAWID